MSHSDDPQNSPTAVKPHLSSVITQTIGRQLHNVASFLAPPPPQQSYSSPTPPLPLRSDVSPSSYEGLKNDLAEIGVSLKTGLSLLSPKKAVTGISKFASSFLQFDKGVVGVTDHVVDFVREVSLRPHCWVDFPLSLLNKDFSMSQVQKDHAIIIQDLVPNLAALRRTVHNVMSEQQFWLIYFILLVPQLNEDDCRLLSTPEILQMHEALLQKLRNKKNTPIATEDTLDEKGSMVNITKPESSSEIDNAAANTTKSKNRASDVCFSDIEDEEFKQTQSSRVSSASENSDWVRIGGTSKANRSRYRGRQSESEESSSDWHAVEDLDL
ncbi:putative BSD domain-containing protein [Helianthus anomalus]